jgi:hypothetical protein
MKTCVLALCSMLAACGAGGDNSGMFTNVMCPRGTTSGGACTTTTGTAGVDATPAPTNPDFIQTIRIHGVDGISACDLDTRQQTQPCGDHIAVTSVSALSGSATVSVQWDDINEASTHQLRITLAMPL